METPVCKIFVEFAEKVCPDYKFVGHVTECDGFSCDPDCVLLSFRHVEKLLKENNMKKFPISKQGKDKEWTFIKEVEGTYENAMLEAQKLQKKDKKYQYRIWDCR